MITHLRSCCVRLYSLRSFVGLLLTVFLFALLKNAAADEQPAAETSPPEKKSDKMLMMVRSGATGRYVFGRWGAVTSSVRNLSQDPQTGLMVVTPSSGGLQFARHLEVPGRTSFDTTWPVLVTGIKPDGPVDFRYLNFPGGKDDGTIRTRLGDSELPSFAVLASDGPLGLAGYIPDPKDERKGEDYLMRLTQGLRYQKLGLTGIASFLARDIGHHADCLDPLDQLTIGDPDLAGHPMAVDAIQAWLQRGGRALVPLDQIGEEAVRSLLGDGMPFTVIGESSSNTIQLDLNEDYPVSQFRDRSVIREFDEPVKYLRMLPGAGEVIWSVDSWPVAVRLPVGRGYVVVTAIDPHVFVREPQQLENGAAAWTPIESMRRFLDTLFEPRATPLVTQEAAASHAAAFVGYSIPGRGVALLLLSIFPVALAVIGLRMLKQSHGERLIWLVPALAVVSAIPAILVGQQIRNVKPETLVETRVMMAGAGASTIVSDGYSSIFVPDPQDLPVSGDTGSILVAQSDGANMSYHRLVWDGAIENHWEKLNQPAGLKTYPIRAVANPGGQYRLTGTFDDQGFVGRLQAPGIRNASDFLIAGQTADRISVRRVDESTLRAGLEDVLDPGQFWDSTIVSEQQLQRKQLMESVFDFRDRLEAFPPTESLLFWESSEESLLRFDSDNLRIHQNTLVIQPIQWVPPVADAPITILSPFMSMRTVETATGGIGGLYNNARRMWMPLESSSTTLLEYLLPSACRPFVVDSAQIRISIRAGGRTLKVYCGDRQNLTLAGTYENPLGELTVDLPAEPCQAAARNGRFYLQLEVSDVTTGTADSSSLGGEQDDNYSISQCIVVLGGRRVEAMPE